MSTIRQGRKQTIMSAKAANGIGTSFDVSKYRHVGIAVIGAGGSPATMTLKVQGSFEMKHNASLDFSAAQSVTNPWDYIGMYDQQDGSFIPGDTGIAFAGANDVRLFLINTDGLRTIDAIVSGYSQGNITVICYPIQAT